MCKFIGKSNERILCELNKSEILRLYSVIHVARETTKTSNFTCQSKFFISIFFTCEVSACELQPFSCHDLANDIHSQTAKTVFSHLKLLNNCKVRSATPNYDLVLVLDTLYDNGHYVTEIANTDRVLMILCSDRHSFIKWFSKTTAEGR